MALFRFTATPSTPPGVEASCLRKKYARHSCQACADVCPVKAIVFSGTVPSVDERVCIGCGHCLFACPSDSLQNIQPVSRKFKADTLVAPLSALAPGTDELLMWHHQYGIRRVELDIDECPGWALAVAELNIRLRKFNEPLWQIVPPAAKTVNLSRRHLLHVTDENVKCGRVTAGRQARRRSFQQHSEYELSLTLSKCVACGACARACPEQALRFNENVLEWSSALCTGCDSCTAVCLPGAITLQQQVQESHRKRFTFMQKTCVCCLHRFYTVNSDEERCHICQRHRHYMREA